MKPFVSFVFPARDHLELLRRAVLALHAQTADVESFEVVVAVDGLDALERVEAAIEPELQPFECRIVESPRTAGRESTPHRNHARNAGCRAARGQYLWILDGDVIADPVAVEHLAALATGDKPRAFSPCLAEPRCEPLQWGELAEETSAVGLLEQRQRFELSSCTPTGRLESYRPGPPTSVRFPRLIEGQPVLPRHVWEALGGFDESFLGYGGNKVSFCRALTLLDSQEGRIEVHLLTSCLFLHQPHSRDPLRTNESHRAENWKRLHQYGDDMRARAPWWRNALARLQ